MKILPCGTRASMCQRRLRSETLQDLPYPRTPTPQSGRDTPAGIPPSRPTSSQGPPSRAYLPTYGGDTPAAQRFIPRVGPGAKGVFAVTLPTVHIARKKAVLLIVSGHLYGKSSKLQWTVDFAQNKPELFVELAPTKHKKKLDGCPQQTAPDGCAKRAANTQKKYKTG